MDKKQAKEIYAKLSSDIQKHADEYYLKDDPTISDSEYDALFERVKNLVSLYPDIDKDHLLSKVGVDVSDSRFNKIRHTAPMLSLDKAHSEEDMRRFFARIREELNIDDVPQMVVEAKLDGLSATLKYVNGTLVSAATRGDGTTGEDVTKNIQYVGGVVTRLNTNNPPKVIEVRGEVVMFKDDFYRLNQEMIERGLKPFANPRNAAAGSLRQIDPRVTEKRKLQFLAYSIVGDDRCGTQWQILQKLKYYGFNVNPEHYLVNNEEEMRGARELIEKKRASLVFDIDGAVYKINSIAFQDKLGNTPSHPRHSIAFKFSPREATSKILNIVWQVGRTGQLTPVANIQPVNIGGVMVSRVTLHNKSEIAKKDIRIGDMVIVYLAGDVIPQIARVVSHDSDTPYEAPQYCTSCGAKLLHYEKTTVCPNHRECPEQIKGRLKLFVSRDAFNITGLGDKTIDALVDKGILSEPADVFGLTEIDVNDNVVSLFTEKKNVTLERFIYSLGIPSVGKRMSEILAKHFESIESFIYNTFDRKLDDVKLRELVGDNVVDNCLSFFKDEYFKQMALDLACKVNIIETPNISGLLSGVSFVFTGALEFVTRQNAKRIAEKAGARVMTDVSSKTDYVVVGANPGSKATKALNLGIRTITEREFLNMCMMEK